MKTILAFLGCAAILAAMPLSWWLFRRDEPASHSRLLADHMTLGTFASGDGAIGGGGVGGGGDCG